MHSKRLRSKKTRVAANEILRSRNKISTMRVVKPEYILLKKNDEQLSLETFKIGE